MATAYTFTVQNKSPNPQGLYFFQEPAIYTGGQEVYSNSLGHQSIPGYQDGIISQVGFVVMGPYYACVQTQTSPPQVGVPQTSEIAAAEIDITKPVKETDNMTEMSIDNNILSLSPATYEAGVQVGAFRIKTAAFNPKQRHYNAGLGGTTGNGQFVLSSFITALPISNVDVQPVAIFYVNTGNYTAGTTIDFTTSSQDAAVCDATSGVTDFLVIYEADETWTVVPITASGKTKRPVLMAHAA